MQPTLAESVNAPAAPAPSSATLTQALPSSPRVQQGNQQGNQIVLNGRRFTAAWSQWQSASRSIRTGISDAGLLQLTGVEFLSTNDASRQPIQWFSQPATDPIALATRLLPPIRYLDITDLAQRSGWQVQAQGTTLQITSTPAKVLSVRQGKQPWGDRIVIELDRPATWQVEQSQEFALTLDAQTDAALLQSLKFTPVNQLYPAQLESTQSQTRLRLGLPIGLRPRVWSLPNPNRLVIDVRPDATVEQSILWAPGLRWRRQTLALGNDRFPVVWLEIDPRQPGVTLRPILPNAQAVVGTAPLLQTAQQTQATAAINGGFFNRNNQLPLGAIRRDRRWLSGPILNRGAIAWNSNGSFTIGRLSLQETVTTSTGQRLPLTYLNSAYVQAGIARYTAEWGPAYTTLSDNEIVVSVQRNQVVNQQTIATAGSSPIPIPSDGYLLVLRANKTAASAFTVGATLQVETAANPPEFAQYDQIVAAGPLLVQNRQIVLNAQAERFSNAFAAELASRSAIGLTSDSKVLLVAVHNRLGGAGASLTETAQLMQQLGAINALNLDGGSSTTLYLGGQLLDRLPRTAARVHNGIGIFLQQNP
ncbi:phosphodiester glycosidase family protein [Leptolyngbya sp. FACHB-36]|nr:phosphodiester glycosidase family protein [Leptolyngbya sp. FACHB-36]